MTSPQTLIKLGQRIYTVRNEKDLSQYELAQAIDESVYFIQQLEQGITDPMLTDIFKVIKALGYTLPDFFDGFETWEA